MKRYRQRICGSVTFQGIGLGIWMLFLSATGYTATITVAQDGSGNVATVQSAIATIQNGDEIVILDDGVYVEDLTAGAGFLMPASFTLRAAEGKTPTIRSANQLSRLAAFGIAEIDYMGAAFLGCQNVLIEGITFENLAYESNSASYAATITIGDSIGVTVRNCTVRGAGSDPEKYPGLNSAFFIVGLGVITAPTDILIESCSIENFYKGFTIAEWPDPAALGNPTVTVRNCTLMNGSLGIDAISSSYPESPDPSTTLAGSGLLFEDNYFSNLYYSGIMMSGGYAVIERNLFERCYTGIDIHYMPSLGVSPVIAKINECDFFDMDGDGLSVDAYNTETNVDANPVNVDVTNSAFVGNDYFGVYVERGTTHFSNCIFTGNGLSAARISYATSTVTAKFDHCDFYRNNQIDYPEYPHFDDQFEILIDPNNQPTRTEFTNCNIVGTRGILNGYMLNHSIYDPEACIASFCNVFTESDPLVNVVSDNILNFEPDYLSASVDPATFDKEGFQLTSGSILVTSGKEGTYIGSQGPATSSAGSWDLYR